jgi:hypothetical protein
MFHILSSAFFWGMVLILCGFSIILNILLGINLPVFRFLVAGFLLYGGILLLTGGKSSVWHCKKKVSSSACEEHTRCFSSGAVDLRNVTLNNSQGSPTCVVVQSTFSNTKILLSQSIPTNIIIQAAFSHVVMPDNSSFSFGTEETSLFNTSNSQEPQLIIKVFATCSNCEIIYK